MAQLVHLTLKSKNEKTGPIPVSTTSGSSCPLACPFNRANAGGCYADGGPLRMHWDKVTKGERGTDWATFCGDISALPEGQLWRHNQAGDLPGVGDAIDAGALAALVTANAGKLGFTYTHKPMTPANLAAVKAANAGGFTVNLSGNNLAHADQLADLEAGPVVVVLPATQNENTTTPAGRKVVVCPATQRDNISCATCGLCQRQRSAIVGFPAHGSSVKKADAIANA